MNELLLSLNYLSLRVLMYRMKESQVIALLHENALAQRKANYCMKSFNIHQGPDFSHMCSNNTSR